MNSMSHLAKKGIEIPKGVEASLDDNLLRVRGPKGELVRRFREEVTLSLADNKINLTPRSQTKLVKSLVGTYASLLRNMIKGVTETFTKRLLIEGTGYRFEVRDKDLSVSAGFSHPVKLSIPAGISVKVEKNELAVSGADKELVGQFAAQIRMIRPPEPYKGKGIRYKDEVISRKVGKKAATASAV